MGAHRRVIVLAATAIMALGTVAGCGSDDEVKKPTLIEGAKSGGKMTIGIPFDQPGLGVKDGDTYSGFDFETATYVAKALGVPAENITFVEATPENRQTLLEDGSVDLVVSTYSITDERKQVVDFAGPYFKAQQDLLVRRNEDEITGPKTLNGRSCARSPARPRPTTSLKHSEGDITSCEKPRFSDCVAALADGDVDAVTTDDVILAGFAAQPEYKGKLDWSARASPTRPTASGSRRATPTWSPRSTPR